MSQIHRFYLVKLLILLTAVNIVFGKSAIAAQSACEAKLAELNTQLQEQDSREIVVSPGGDLEIATPFERDRAEFEAKKRAFEKYVQEEGLLFADPIFSMIAWEITKDEDQKKIEENPHFRYGLAGRILEKVYEEYYYYSVKNREGDEAIEIFGRNPRPYDIEDLDDQIEEMTFLLDDGELYGISVKLAKHRARILREAFKNEDQKKALKGLIADALKLKYGRKLNVTAMTAQTTRVYNSALSVFGNRWAPKTATIHLTATALVTVGLAWFGFTNPAVVSQTTSFLTGPMVVRPDLFAGLGGSIFLGLSSIPQWLPSMARRMISRFWNSKIDASLGREQALIAGGPGETRSLVDFQRQIDFATDLQSLNQAIDKIQSYNKDSLKDRQKVLKFKQDMLNLQTASWEVGNDIRLSHLFDINQDIHDAQQLVRQIIKDNRVDSKSRSALSGFNNRFSSRLGLLVGESDRSNPSIAIIYELQERFLELKSHIEGLDSSVPELDLRELVGRIDKMLSSLEEYHEIYKNIERMGNQLLSRTYALLEGNVSDGLSFVDEADSLAAEASRLDPNVEGSL